MNDVTFTIPVQIDSPDRLQNLTLIVRYLQHHFNAKIIIGEQKTNLCRNIPGTEYMPFQHLTTFHRTKMLNDMAEAAGTLIVANYDCDILLPINQIIETVNLLKCGSDMCYPYDGTFWKVNRQLWIMKLEKSLSTEILLKAAPRFDISSVGGCVFVNKDAFFAAGGENENMISYGPEDVERIERWNKLGYKVARVGGPLYHIDHRRGPDSMARGHQFKRNHDELNRMRAMTAEGMRTYVDSWTWNKVKY